MNTQFLDPALSAAIVAAGPLLRNATERYDSASKDIRALESYLNEAGVRVGASVNVGSHPDHFCGLDIDGDHISVQEQVEWSEKSGRWRLHYRAQHVVLERWKQGVGCDEGPTRGELVAEKPLMEMDGPTRLRAAKALGGLVQNLAAQVGQHSPLYPALPVEAPDPWDEVPF